jgi:hypothetical protein
MLRVRTLTSNRVIRADPRVNCREVNTRSRIASTGIFPRNGKRSVGEAIKLAIADL